MKSITADPAKQLDVYFRIDRDGAIEFDFYDSNGSALPISSYTFVLNIKSSHAYPTNTLQLTESSGLTKGTSSLIATITKAQAALFREQTYYYELVRTKNSLQKNWLTGNAFFHNGIFDGVTETIESITINESSQIISVSIFDSSAVSSGVTTISGTANQISASASTGAVTLSLPSAVIFPGTWAIGTLGYSDTGILFSASSTVNSYNQAIIQNKSNGVSASANFNVSNDSGTSTTFFGEFGINSSGFTGSSVFSQPSYVYLASGSTDLAIGTYGANAIHFVINSANTDALTISSKQSFTFNQLTQTSGWTSALKFNIGSHTGYTTTTEFIDFDLGTSGRTAQWLAGTTATQRFFYLRGTTVTGTGGTATFTDAYTAFIDPTIQGTGSSITRNWALGLGGSAIIYQTATSNPGYYISNSAGSLIAGMRMVSGQTLQISAGTGGGNMIDFVDNTGLTTMCRFIGSSSNGVSSFSFNSTTTTNATFYILQSAFSSGWKPVLRVDPGAHTAMTASTEFPDVVWSGSSHTWLAGTIATQRFHWWKANSVVTGTATDAITAHFEKPTGSVTNAFSVTTDGMVRFGGSVICSTGALATNATDGFLYVPSCAGTPTGTPTTRTGTIPMIYDSTNNFLYVYNGGAWKKSTVYA